MVRQLTSKFDLDAVAVTASSAARLERALPPSQTLFRAHPFTVVSLDYIKSDLRRDEFARACPEFVIVDEAHACVGTHQGRQQRFELLKRLGRGPERHLVLLTATPHSGDEAAFDRLSACSIASSGGSLDRRGRAHPLARHFVQRRRIDIGRDWGGAGLPATRDGRAGLPIRRGASRLPRRVLDYCLASSKAPGRTSAGGGWRSGAHWR